MNITIKTPEEFDKMRIAGKIISDLFKILETEICVGKTSAYINELAYRHITDRGGIPSFLNYEGFPFSVCASLNDEVVHGFCNDKPLEDGDIISIDVGVNYQGLHADACRTYAVGNISDDAKKLIETTKQSFFAGIEGIKAGSKLGHISARIQQYAESRGYGVVRELVGHGIGHELHEDPNVPNYGNYNSGVVLRNGMALAIEPMLNMGTKEVYLDNNMWTVKTDDGELAAHYENTILIFENTIEIITI